MSKKDPLHHDPIDVLGEAYEALLERSIEEAEKAKSPGSPAFHNFIDATKDTVAEVQELSREEMDQVSVYLKRDLQDAAVSLSKSKDELSGWLGFERDRVEDALFDRFLKAADQTTLNLLELQYEAEAYHTGEVTGPGTLVCDACGKAMHFEKPGKIPPCPSCHATSFHRAES